MKNRRAEDDCNRAYENVMNQVSKFFSSVFLLPPLKIIPDYVHALNYARHTPVALN